MDESQAIKRLKKGDISGLEFLITRYQVRAVRTAFLITHDEKMAEDVVQDTYLRIYQRIHHFDERQPFEPYFMRCVTHAALNAAEKFSRQVALSEDDEAAVLERLIQNASTTEDLVDYTLLKQEIFSVLAKLSPRERSVIVERYYLEMSEKEMADKHSVAPGTVKWLLNEARRHLRTFMKPEGES
jgi:RNA polymerase sigma-70 factor (ECF subfamily)